MSRPLDGITVITLEQATAAPFCTGPLAGDERFSANAKPAANLDELRRITVQALPA